MHISPHMQMRDEPLHKQKRTDNVRIFQKRPIESSWRFSSGGRPDRNINNLRVLLIGSVS